MSFVFIGGKPVAVHLKTTGTFFCLYCNAEQQYQHRAWESVAHLFFVPLGFSTGEFVLCLNCESAFAPECLDETSTATCDDLIMEVPMRAARADLRFRPRTAPPAPAYDEPDEAPTYTARPSPRPAAVPAETPVRGQARRTPRRH